MKSGGKISHLAERCKQTYVLTSAQPLRPQTNNIQVAAGPSRSQPLPKVAAPIHMSFERAVSNPTAPIADGNEETFDVRGIDQTYDPRLTAAEAQKALQDLVADVYNGDDDQEYTVEDATVDGFRDGISLLPHQVIGRKWMAERESGKKRGGMLADDMGLVAEFICPYE